MKFLLPADALYRLMWRALDDPGAAAELAAETSFHRLFPEGSSCVAVAEGMLYVGRFPERGGGVATVPLPPGMGIAAVEHRDGIFTLHFADGRRVRADWKSLRDLMVYQVPTLDAQRREGDVERALLNLRPSPPSGSTSSAVAGELSPSGSAGGYAGSWLHGRERRWVYARACHLAQLEAMLPALDRALAGFSRLEADAGAFLNARGVHEGPLLVTEVVAYDGGALDLSAGLGEEAESHGIDFVTVQMRADGTALDLSFN